MPNRLIDCLRRAALLKDGGGLSDGQLLGLFVKHRDGDAFAALLKRHSPIVLGVCRRVLTNQHDAEDAFQATFLVFARKAGSVKALDSLAGWLYRVAYRTALEARARIARRRSKEQQLDGVPPPAFESDDSQRELLALLDKELDRLPDKYRVPVVLCELEGMSRKEAAKTLGLAEGTLSWRLAQAKKLLARRLSRHGLAISGGSLAAVMTPGVASACLRASTVKAVTAGTVPAKVLALTDGVLRAMLLSKLKITICAAALMLLTGVGISSLTYRAAAQSPQSRETLTSRSQADELEALRLEIEALRKSLQATRERVKALEDEVSALKGQRQGPPGMGPGGGRGGRPGGFPSMSGRPQGMEPPGMKGGGMMMQGMMRGAGIRPKPKTDPVTDAENALKKLKENPGDKKATEALEKALQRLKEREKSDAPGQPDQPNPGRP